MTVVLAVIAAILIVAIGAFVRAYWNGLATELGAATARALADRRRRRRKLQTALEVVRAGGAPATILAAVAGTERTDVLERALSRVDRPAALTALQTALQTAGPFLDKVPIVIGVGPQTVPLLKSVLADPQFRTVPSAFAVGVDTVAAEVPIQHAKGDIWTQLDEAFEWAGHALSQGNGDFIAVLLSTPITGNWSGDVGLDLSRLFKTIFRDRTRSTWLSYSEPIDPSAWPDEVIVDFEIQIDEAIRVLGEAGVAAFRVKKKISDHSAVMVSTDAVDLLLTLMSPARMVIRADSAVDATAILPPYSAAITLALEPATQAGEGYVGRDLSLAKDVEDVLASSGIRVSAFAGGTPLPLSVYRGQVTAWQLVSTGRSAISASSSRSTVVNEDGTEEEAARQWLVEAIASNDDQVAAAVLASHGRAWIEAAHPPSAIEPIQRAMSAFPEYTRAHLWARYLIALDSALRMDSPTDSWFTQHWCNLADATELGPLFHAERMEFCRLRGELEAACKYATVLAKVLRANPNSTTPTNSYALGTANFLLGNLLRRGGRYDIARSFIDQAVDIFEETIPSHRIELQHCRYATAVCESMQGVATVTSSYEWPSGQAIFGRSLVTLANSHAAWFIADYSRAIEFAKEARQGFEVIGYQRYAARAGELTALIANWADLAGSPVGLEVGNISNSLSELLTAKGDIEMLQGMRPSRALSLLQFAVAFAQQPNATRVVTLPAYITLNDDEEFELTTPSVANSFRRAERILRSVMSIGARTRVPLAAD